MDSRPTLLERIAPDYDAIGWNVIDRETCERLASRVNLPKEARLELVHIVIDERHKRRWLKHGPERPGKSKKNLKDLHKLAGKLADGLRALGTGARSAVMIALSEEDRFKHFPLLLPADEVAPVDFEMEAVECWRDRLGRAVEIANHWHVGSGADPGLRRVVGALDALMIRHTGKGLVRASTATKREGRATACQDFVREIYRLIFGEEVSPLTIDDAIKDVIKRRRSVGRL